MGGQQLYAGICESLANGWSGGRPDRRETILPDWIDLFHSRFPIFGPFPFPRFADYGSRIARIRRGHHVAGVTSAFIPYFPGSYRTEPCGHYLGQHR